jgi:hypothetical protein
MMQPRKLPTQSSQMEYAKSLPVPQQEKLVRHQHFISRKKLRLVLKTIT